MRLNIKFDLNDIFVYNDTDQRTRHDMTKPVQKAVYTPNEVAELLMVSPVTIRQWAQKGMIEAMTTAGGHRRFSLEAVRQFARERDIDLSLTLGDDASSLLIVDDDEQLNRFLVALFNSRVSSLTVHSAADGFQAGRLMQAHVPDVVLLDVMMPGIDGVAVCKSIKGDAKTAHARVIGMTGFYSDELAARMRAAGAETLLRKPFDNEEVIRRCGFAA